MDQIAATTPSSEMTIDAWARFCADALAWGLKPLPLLPGRSLTAEEAELAHRLLQLRLADRGISIG